MITFGTRLAVEISCGPEEEAGRGWLVDELTPERSRMPAFVR